MRGKTALRADSMTKEGDKVYFNNIEFKDVPLSKSQIAAYERCVCVHGRICLISFVVGAFVTVTTKLQMKGCL